MDEFGRLDLINATAFQSIAISDDVITNPLSVQGLVDSAGTVEARARLLAESVMNITSPSPLTTLGNIILMYVIYTLHQHYVCFISVDQVNSTLVHFSGRQATNWNLIISGRPE